VDREAVTKSHRANGNPAKLSCRRAFVSAGESGPVDQQHRGDPRCILGNIQVPDESAICREQSQL
jgi:hypothetical protein